MAHFLCNILEKRVLIWCVCMYMCMFPAGENPAPARERLAGGREQGEWWGTEG